VLFTDISSERAVNAFKKAGFTVKRKGKHIVMYNGKDMITIPKHKRLNPYTLKSIIKDAGLTDKDFKKLL
jgi:predicted RNA binding protein YcfA (HicA-like mRNA interferase family)